MTLPAFIPSTASIDGSLRVRGGLTTPYVPPSGPGPTTRGMCEPQPVWLDCALGRASGVAPFAMVLAASRRPAANSSARQLLSLENLAERGARAFWPHLPVRTRGLLYYLGSDKRAVSAVAVIHDRFGRVLVGYHRYKDPVPWSLPGGMVRRGEDPAAAVVRELGEELGVEAEVISLVAHIHHEQGRLELVYRCRRARGEWSFGAEMDGAAYFPARDYALPTNMDPHHRQTILSRAARSPRNR